ncbi:MAG: cellulose-binding protein [Microcoleaceae cyanobacterium]
MNSSTFPMGTNLAGIAEWSTQYPFTDYFKSSRDWITHGQDTWDTDEANKLSLDENGWVKSLDGGDFVSVGAALPNDDQGRRFVVLYDGEGDLEYSLGAEEDEAASQPGRDVFYAKPEQNLNLRIIETDPNQTGDYIRNIRVIPEEYEAIYESQIFNPDFLDSLEGYETLRFMDWMKTNGSEQREWSDRVEPEDSNYVGEGVPVEVMVELANETGIDPWFTIPHQATDDYVRNFAEYVKENLDPDLDVYVEYSNEVWNYQFDQANYVLDQGKQEFPDLKNDGQKARYWFGQRTSEITQTWDQVFGTDNDRVIGVLGAQAANSGTALKSLEYLESTGLSHEDLGIDAIAIAPYFSLPLNNSSNVDAIIDWTEQGMTAALDNLFQEVIAGGVLPNGYAGGSIQESAARISKYVDIAEQEDLDLIAYEGGQHLSPRNGMENNPAIVDLFIAANRDPRMGAAYSEYFEVWDELTGDGVFAHFNDVGNYTKWGSWGSRESLYQESSPKFDAIQDVIAGYDGSSSNPEDEPTPINILIAVLPDQPNPGLGEKDILLGDVGPDLFVLGNSTTAFYNDHSATSQGSWASLATLQNFVPGEDQIQLYGAPTDYILKAAQGSTRIFETTDPSKELIGIVQGVTGLDLNNPSQFSFV